MAFEHAERDAEEDVESIKEQDVPYAEKRLIKAPYFIFSYFYQRQRDKSDDEREKEARYLDGQTVGKEGEEPREADCGEVDS